MPMIVHAHTIIYPGAMAVSYRLAIEIIRKQRYPLVMFCYATITSLAMLASQWLANHAWHAKVLIIKFP